MERNTISASYTEDSAIRRIVFDSCARNYHRGIVQLGEHLHDAQEAGGSSPPVPIHILQSDRVGKRRSHMAFHVGSVPVSATLGP